MRGHRPVRSQQIEKVPVHIPRELRAGWVWNRLEGVPDVVDRRLDFFGAQAVTECGHAAAAVYYLGNTGRLVGLFSSDSLEARTASALAFGSMTACAVGFVDRLPIDGDRRDFLFCFGRGGGFRCSFGRGGFFGCFGCGGGCLLYTSPSPRDRQKSRMPSSA